MGEALTPPPSDLAEFWAGTLAKARATPNEARDEKLKEKLPYFVHRLTIKSLGGVPVRAYLSLPVNDGNNGRAPMRLPLVVTMPGYGGYEMGQMLGECLRGFAILQVYPRSQGESGDLWRVEDGAYQAWVNHGKHNREGFYYQGAIMDLVRAIDYVVTRDDIDGSRIATSATSQGGMLALQLAGVDARIRACVSHVPCLCDYRRSPTLVGTELATDEAFKSTWDYFEPVNVATLIKAPTLLSAGGKDKTCPPQTIHTVYERLSCVRSIAHYPELTHTSCGDFYGMGWEWIERYLR